MKKKEMDFFTALYEVASAINASLEPARVLEKIVQSVVQAMDLKAASIRLLDDREKKLVLGGAYGLSEDYIHKGPILVDESGVDSKALRGRTIYLRDAQTDKGFQYG